MEILAAQKSPVQKRRIRQTVVYLLLLMALMVLGVFYRITQPRILSSHELRANGAILFDHPRIIEDFRLQDEKGQAFTQAELTGHWTLLFLGFTHCPDICPTTLAKLAEVHKNLQPEIAAQTRVVLLSVDPARDTPVKLAEYVHYFNPEFIGLTGDFRQIMTLTQNLNGVFQKVVQGDDYTVDHTANLILINPEGHYQGFIQPPFELARLTTVIESIVSAYY
ncbi:ggdef [Teredinibacter turnerae T7901]|uniref:Ggdef n=1 Tax=Teredinibacter turnerae (strain ATCC 39867 / T7901) TaxID=377629 RepID=C5BKU6_TERTT|nr:SCO family protein [Teredinibacter turnerae]ACR11746.1 ggdef [Teredinibacter turnerae T7901]